MPACPSPPSTVPGCPPRLGGAAGAGGLCPWLGSRSREGRILGVRGAPDQAPAKQDTPGSHGFFTGLVPKGRGGEDREELREPGRREGLPGWNRAAAFEIRVGPGVPGPSLLPRGGRPGVGSPGQEGGGSPGLRLGVGPGSAGGSQAWGPWRMVSVLPALSKGGSCSVPGPWGQGGPAVPTPVLPGPPPLTGPGGPRTCPQASLQGARLARCSHPRQGSPVPRGLPPQTRARPPPRALCRSGRQLTAHPSACVLGCGARGLSCSHEALKMRFLAGNPVSGA